jgi:predicted DNA repair protein MutK
MKRPRFHIAVAVLAGILFLAVTVAHACIGTVASHGAHDHSGIQAAGLVQTTHSEAQDENCRSVRDRLVSLAPELSQTHSLVGDLQTILVIGEQVITEIQRLTAERPPGANSTADDQPPLYIFNSVFRI